MDEKAAYKMLVKLAPGPNFTNILKAAFAPIFLHQKSTKNVSTNKLRAKLSYDKAARKMLVKLTPASHSSTDCTKMQPNLSSAILLCQGLEMMSLLLQHRRARKKRVGINRAPIHIICAPASNVL